MEGSWGEWSGGRWEVEQECFAGDSERAGCFGCGFGVVLTGLERTVCGAG